MRWEAISARSRSQPGAGIRDRSGEVNRKKMGRAGEEEEEGGGALETKQTRSFGATSRSPELKLLPNPMFPFNGIRPIASAVRGLIIYSVANFSRIRLCFSFPPLTRLEVARRSLLLGHVDIFGYAAFQRNVYSVG